MKLNPQQHENGFLDKLTRAPRGLEKKVLPKHKLDPFFNVISLEDLVFTLYQFSVNHYLKYVVTLSNDYLNWEQAHTNALQDTRNLKPVEPFGPVRQHKYHLAILGHEIKTDTPLSPTEISEVIETLPTNLAEQFLRFKLSEIDQRRMREIVAARTGTLRRKLKADNYYIVEHKGLVIGIADVTYKGKFIRLRKQQRELLRVFVEHPGVTLAYETFYDNPEIFRPNKTHKNPHETVSKLISETHKILRERVGECIFNKPTDGWYLEIS